MTTIRTSPKTEAELRKSLQQLSEGIVVPQDAGATLNGIGSLTISNPPTQTQVESVRDAVAELVSKLKAAKVLK